MVLEIPPKNLLPVVGDLTALFCHLGFLPLAASKDGKLQTSLSQYFKFALANFGLLTLLSSVLLVHMLWFGGGASFLRAMVEDGRMKHIDHYSVLGSSAVCYLVDLAYWAAVCRTAHRISSDGESVTLRPLGERDVRAVRRKVLAFLAFLLAVFLCMFGSIVALVNISDIFLPWYMDAVYAVLSPLLWMPPAVIAGQALVYAHLEFYSRHLKNLELTLAQKRQKIESAGADKAIYHEEEVGEGEENLLGMAKEGLAITRNIHQFGLNFGPLILADVSSCFVVGIFSYYFLSVTLDLVLDFNATRAAVLGCSYALCLTLEVRKVSLFRQGHKVTRDVGSCKEELIRLRLALTRRRFDDDDAKLHLELLEKRLGEECPLRPCGIFSLDYESLAAAYALLLTYSIVLIQLKMTEH